MIENDKFYDDMICYRCQQKGHIAKYCPNEKVKTPYDKVMTLIRKASALMEIASQTIKEIKNEKWRNEYLNRIMELEYKKKEVFKLKENLMASKFSSLDTEVSTKPESNLKKLLDNNTEVEVEEIQTISSFSSSSIDTKTAKDAWNNILNNPIFKKVVRLRKGVFGLTNNQYNRILEFVSARLNIESKPKKNINTEEVFALATNLHFWAKKFGTPNMKQKAKDILQCIHNYNEYAEPKQPDISKIEINGQKIVPHKAKVVVDDHTYNKIMEKKEADNKIEGTTESEIRKVVEKEKNKKEKEIKKIREDKKKQHFQIKQNQIRENNAERRFQQNYKMNKMNQNRNFAFNKKRHNYIVNRDRQNNKKNYHYNTTSYEYEEPTGNELYDSLPKGFKKSLAKDEHGCGGYKTYGKKYNYGNKGVNLVDESKLNDCNW